MFLYCFEVSSLLWSQRVDQKEVKRLKEEVIKHCVYGKGLPYCYMPQRCNVTLPVRSSMIVSTDMIPAFPEWWGNQCWIVEISVQDSLNVRKISSTTNVNLYFHFLTQKHIHLPILEITDEASFDVHLWRASWSKAHEDQGHYGRWHSKILVCVLWDSHLKVQSFRTE